MPTTNSPIASNDVPIGRRMKIPEIFMEAAWPEMEGGDRRRVNTSSRHQRTNCGKVDPLHVPVGATSASMLLHCLRRASRLKSLPPSTRHAQCSPTGMHY